MGSGSSRSLGGGAANAAAIVTTPRNQKISSVLPELVAETALAREDAIAECYTTLARLDTSEQLGPLLALFLRLFPDTPEEEVERLLTEGGEGAPVIASEAQLVELVNNTIDRLGAGPTGVRPARWAAPAQRGDALLTIQKAVRQLVTRMAVVERFRFQLWDRLDGWEELELNQLGAFICECAKSPSPSMPTTQPLQRIALLHPVAGCLTTPRSFCPRLMMSPQTDSARSAARPAIHSRIGHPTLPRNLATALRVGLAQAKRLELCSHRGHRRFQRRSRHRTWCA